MEFLVTREEMQFVDSYSIHTIGIPGIVLMERASLCMEKEILSRYPKAGSVLIVTERGNNGGDGLALGRMLLHDGIDVDIYEIGGIPQATESYETQKKILHNLGVELHKDMPEGDYDLIIDAIFGVGLKREVKGKQAEAVRAMNEKSGVKIALDVPTGLDATTGHVLGETFQADLTITVGLHKIGLALYPGAEYAGEVAVKDIGFPRQSVETAGAHVCYYTKRDLNRLPRRQRWSNKGTYGRVLVTAGAVNMAGAAYLSGKAACRSGAGLVRLFTDDANRLILQERLPEAIMTTWKEGAGDCANLESLKEAVRWATVIVFGPGLGVSPWTEKMLRVVLKEGECPLVMDADGINVFSQMEDGRALLASYRGDVIFTPHLKEMSRLTGCSVGEIQDNLIDICRSQAQVYKEDVSKKEDSCAQRILVEKDWRTIVSDGQDVYINMSGNDGMSTAGSGDVLTGVIAGLLAGGAGAFEAAKLGVYCHGLAGDAAVEEKGHYALSSDDIADAICRVIR